MDTSQIQFWRAKRATKNYTYRQKQIKHTAPAANHFLKARLVSLSAHCFARRLFCPQKPLAGTRSTARLPSSFELHCLPRGRSEHNSQCFFSHPDVNFFLSLLFKWKVFSLASKYFEKRSRNFWIKILKSPKPEWKTKKR